jgi:hypothetical protein
MHISHTEKIWLHSPEFDFILIIGVFAFTLIMGEVAMISPKLLLCVLYVNFWLLAPAHLVSTFTRIAFDNTKIRRYWFLLFALPPIVLLATISLTWVGGVIALNTLYFLWQTWHYTKQSYGITRSYKKITWADVFGNDRLTESVIFAFPLWGLLYRAHQQPVQFFDNPIWCINVPESLLTFIGAFAICSLILWLLRLVYNYIYSSESATGHNLFVVSHVGMTIISYFAVNDIMIGWLFINIWHNAQYILFVWMRNRKQFSSGIHPDHYIVSWLAQPHRKIYYTFLCLIGGVGFYYLLGEVSKLMTWKIIPLALILYQTVAFHHYLVDAVIWRAPRRQDNL